VVLALSLDQAGTIFAPIRRDVGIVRKAYARACLV